MNKLKKRINSDEGFVLSVVYMMFLVIILSLAGLSINVQNNSKYTNLATSDDSVYYYADYGIQKAQHFIKEFAENQPEAKRIEYAESNTDALATDLKPKLIGLFYEEITNSQHLVNMDVKVHINNIYEPSRKYVIIVTATVQDSTRGKFVTSEAKLGARIAPSYKASDEGGGNIEEKLHKVLFGSIVEVKKNHGFAEY